MPVHDWTRVEAGTFHDFHNRWITHLAETLNDGLLPAGFYALSEQHGNRLIADILTLDSGDRPPSQPPSGAAAPGLAVAEPQIGRKFVASPKAYYRLARRTVAIRHVSDNRVVALVEVLLGNDDGLAAKMESARREGIHVVVVDLSRHVGKPLPAMPLFLDTNGHVNVPLEETYQATYRRTPGHVRKGIAGS